MATYHPYLGRVTTSVLAAVALVSGAILLLGDRFDAARGDVLAQAVAPVPPEARIAACVADESMHLINPGKEQCRPGERELMSEHPHQAVGADGVTGYEIVTARVTVAGRQAATGEARCPAGKVALGGGVLPDADAGKGRGVEDRLAVVASGPLAPGGDSAGGGWTATVSNTGTPPLAVVVAAVCVASR